MLFVCVRVRLTFVCVMCCDLGFDVACSGLIVCVCARVCCCNVVVWFVCACLGAAFALLCVVWVVSYFML